MVLCIELRVFGQYVALYHTLLPKFYCLHGPYQTRIYQTISNMIKPSIRINYTTTSTTPVSKTFFHCRYDKPTPGALGLHCSGVLNELRRAAAIVLTRSGTTFFWNGKTPVFSPPNNWKNWNLWIFSFVCQFDFRIPYFQEWFEVLEILMPNFTSQQRAKSQKMPSFCHIA